MDALPSPDGMRIIGSRGTKKSGPAGVGHHFKATLNGMPIYYYARDRKGGDIPGQEVSDAWYLVSPSGEMLASAGGYQLLHP